MHGTRNKEPGRHAVALLATCCVVAGGVISCAFVVLGSGATPRQAIGVCAGCFGAVIFLLWLLRDKPPVNPTAAQYSWFRRNWKAKKEVEYEPRRRKTREAPPPAPAPPTVESIRELANNVNTWVPSAGARSKRNDAP